MAHCPTLGDINAFGLSRSSAVGDLVFLYDSLFMVVFRAVVRSLLPGDSVFLTHLILSGVFTVMVRQANIGVFFLQAQLYLMVVLLPLVTRFSFPGYLGDVTR